MSDADPRTDAIPTRNRLYADALDRLSPSGPVRFATLATRARKGGASARMVVIRGFDRAAMALSFHTHVSSAKCAEIADDAAGELVVWDASDLLQVRARVTLAARGGTPSEWNDLAPPERMNYPGHLHPGAPLEAPDVMADPDPSRFVVVTARIETLDVLRLGRDFHLRAIYPRAEGFKGRWIGP